MNYIKELNKLNTAINSLIINFNDKKGKTITIFLLS